MPQEGLWSCTTALFRLKLGPGGAGLWALKFVRLWALRFVRKNTKCLHGRVVNAQALVLHWFLGSGGGGPEQGEVCEGGRPSSGTWGSATPENPWG